MIGHGHEGAGQAIGAMRARRHRCYSWRRSLGVISCDMSPLVMIRHWSAGQAVGAHEGPQTQALRLAGDPLAPPLVPPGGQTPPVALATAQGAAFFGMLEEYSDNTSPGAFQARLQLVFVYGLTKYVSGTQVP